MDDGTIPRGQRTRRIPVSPPTPSPPPPPPPPPPQLVSSLPSLQLRSGRIIRKVELKNLSYQSDQSDPSSKSSDPSKGEESEGVVVGSSCQVDLDPTKFDPTSKSSDPAKGEESEEVVVGSSQVKKVDWTIQRKSRTPRPRRLASSPPPLLPPRVSSSSFPLTVYRKVDSDEGESDPEKGKESEEVVVGSSLVAPSPLCYVELLNALKEREELVTRLESMEHSIAKHKRDLESVPRMRIADAEEFGAMMSLVKEKMWRGVVEVPMKAAEGVISFFQENSEKLIGIHFVIVPD